MGNQSPYRIERCETPAQLDALENEWAKLITGIPGVPVFLSWEWIRTWWFYYGKDRDLWLLTARDTQGRLVGLAPLMRERHPFGLVKLRMIDFIGTNAIGPLHLNILTRVPDQASLIQAFLDFLLTQSNQWDVIRFSNMTQDSTLAKLAAAGGRFRTGAKKISTYVPLPDSWEAYQKALTKKLRRNLKYFRSKLDHDFPERVRFVRITDPQEIPGAMKKLEELNKNRWHAKERASNFDDANFPAFHQAIASLALERGWLRLYQLTVAGRVIAQCYNFLFHHHLYAYAIGFDLEWSGYSPGRLAIANSIQSAIEDGACEYDWLSGEEAYKFAWTDQTRLEDEILLSSNLMGGIWVNWQSSSEAFRRTLTTAARRWIPQSYRDRVNQLLSPHYKKSEERDDKETK